MAGTGNRELLNYAFDWSAMSNRFDPYFEWLQVHSSSLRPTHYELLSVSSTESDATVIKAAAITQIKKLQALNPGSRSDLRDSIEKEVRRSFQVLTNAKARSDYDRELLNKSVSQNDLEPPSSKNINVSTNAKTRSEHDQELLNKSVSQNDLEPPSSCLLYTSPSPRDQRGSRMPSSA